MPRLSTSDRAKVRVIHLLKSLLMYANHELDDWHGIADRLIVKWLTEEGRSRLLVQTTLNTLVELASPSMESGGTKEQMRHDLRLLKEFLKILDDHRLKTQGAENWHFTLNLWSKSTHRNLEEVEREWTHRKYLQSGGANYKLGSTAFVSDSSAVLNDEVPPTIHRPSNVAISKKRPTGLSTSDRAKVRVVNLLKILLMYANHEPDDWHGIADRLIVKWLSEEGRSRLLVQTTLNTLVELASPSMESGGTKEQMRHDLRLLKEFLKILDDHRLKTQGAENWHFTLNLWFKSTHRNLEEVEREWTHRKHLQSGGANYKLGSTAFVSDSSAVLNDEVPPTIHRPSR